MNITEIITEITDCKYVTLPFAVKYVNLYVSEFGYEGNIQI